MARYRLLTPHRPWAEPVTTRGAPFSERLVAAYHEAGHAFMALWEGIPVKDVYVTDRGNGKCSCGMSGTADKAAWIKSRMRAAYAAQEAQRWVDPHGMFRSCRYDRDSIAEVVGSIAALTGDENSAWAFADTARQEAARIVNEFWPFIKKIAKALNKRGWLTGNEIWEILGGKPKVRRANEPAITTRPADIPPCVPQTKSAPPILMARVDGGINLPPDLPPPDPGQCEAVTRAFQRRHSVRDYAF